MYSIPLIGAFVTDLNGEPVGVVHSIEHTSEGPNVVIYTGEEDEPKVKEPAPSPTALNKLRAVSNGDA